MTFIPHTFTTKRLAILTGLAAGIFLGVPAIAQEPANPSQNSVDSSNQMQQPAMNSANPSAMNIVEVASGNQSFNTLTQAIQATGLADTLKGQGPYTVFAPTDEAFAQLPPGALQFLLQPENRDLLRQVLTYHVISGEVPASQIKTGAIQTLGGGLAARVTPEGRVVINNASVVQPNIQATNGVIHVVNRVLLPENLQRALATRLGVQSIY